MLSLNLSSPKKVTSLEKSKREYNDNSRTEKGNGKVVLAELVCEPQLSGSRAESTPLGHFMFI